jgi:hypothetical protein
MTFFVYRYFVKPIYTIKAYYSFSYDVENMEITQPYYPHFTQSYNPHQTYHVCIQETANNCKNHRLLSSNQFIKNFLWRHEWKRFWAVLLVTVSGFLKSPVTKDPARPMREAWGDVSSSISSTIYRRSLGFYACRRPTPTARLPFLSPPPPQPPRPVASAIEPTRGIRPGTFLLSGKWTRGLAVLWFGCLWLI